MGHVVDALPVIVASVAFVRTKLNLVERVLSNSVVCKEDVQAFGQNL